jgi:hypothetical protein
MWRARSPISISAAAVGTVAVGIVALPLVWAYQNGGSWVRAAQLAAATPGAAGARRRAPAPTATRRSTAGRRPILLTSDAKLTVQRNYPLAGSPAITNALIVVHGAGAATPSPPCWAWSEPPEPRGPRTTPRGSSRPPSSVQRALPALGWSSAVGSGRSGAR